MRVAAFRTNGKLLATFTSLEQAAKVLNIRPVKLAEGIAGKTKTVRALEGSQRKLGSLIVREIDERSTGVS